MENWLPITWVRGWIDWRLFCLLFGCYKVASSSYWLLRIVGLIDIHWLLILYTRALLTWDNMKNVYTLSSMVLTVRVGCWVVAAIIEGS